MPESTLSPENQEYADRTRKARESKSGDRAPSSGRSTRSGGRSPAGTSSKLYARVTATHSRRILVAEFLASVILVTVGSLASKQTPHPKQYMATFVVFLMLGFMAEFGDGSARLAAGIGGLVLVAQTMQNATAITAAIGVVTGHTGATATVTEPTEPGAYRPGTPLVRGL